MIQSWPTIDFLIGFCVIYYFPGPHTVGSHTVGPYTVTKQASFFITSLELVLLRKSYSPGNGANKKKRVQWKARETKFTLLTLRKMGLSAQLPQVTQLSLLNVENVPGAMEKPWKLPT